MRRAALCWQDTTSSASCFTYKWHLRVNGACTIWRFPFDSVLAPYNYVQMRDPRYASTFEALAAVCAERQVALQTIKSLALRPGRAGPGRPTPGTSPCATSPTSTWRPTGSSAAPTHSCSPPATSTSCPACSTPPSASSNAHPTRQWTTWQPGASRSPCSCSQIGLPEQFERGPRPVAGAPVATGARSLSAYAPRSRRRRTQTAPDSGECPPDGAG